MMRVVVFVGWDQFNALFMANEIGLVTPIIDQAWKGTREQAMANGFLFGERRTVSEQLCVVLSEVDGEDYGYGRVRKDRLQIFFDEHEEERHFMNPKVYLTVNQLEDLRRIGIVGRQAAEAIETLAWDVHEKNDQIEQLRSRIGELEDRIRELSASRGPVADFKNHCL